MRRTTQGEETGPGYAWVNLQQRSLLAVAGTAFLVLWIFAESLLGLLGERFVDVGWKENKPYNGIVEALAAVASAGHTMFVATAKPHMHAARIIEHFGMGEYIHNVYGSELDGTRATKTELLEFALDRNPGATRHIMIGDRKHDLIGAVANKMTPIGVAYGYGSVEELEGAGATAIAGTPGDLPGLLR